MRRVLARHKGRVDVPEPAADPGGGQAAGRGGPFPGQAQVRCQRPGEPQLGVAGDDDPGPPVRCLGVSEFRGGPPEDLLEQPERVLKIETAEERLPHPVHRGGRGAGDRAPQPHRLGSTVPGQAVHLQAHQGALDHRQRPVIV